MALKECRECGEKVSSKAATCPKCGAPVRKKRSSVRGVIGCLFVCLLAVIIIVTATTGKDSGARRTAPQRAAAAPRQPTPAPRVTLPAPIQSNQPHPTHAAAPPPASPPALSKGMSPDEVLAARGKPDRRAAVGNLAVWWYGNGLQVTFKEDKLAEWKQQKPQPTPPEETAAAPSDSAPQTSGNLSPQEQGRRFFQALLEAGAIQKYDLQMATVWVDPLVWAMMNRDQKEQFITTCAAAREAMGGVLRIEIRSYSNDAMLGKWGILGPSIEQ